MYLSCDPAPVKLYGHMGGSQGAIINLKVLKLLILDLIFNKFFTELSVLGGNKTRKM